jgi:hypothetical protein
MINNGGRSCVVLIYNIQFRYPDIKNPEISKQDKTCIEISWNPIHRDSNSKYDVMQEIYDKKYITHIH